MPRSAHHARRTRSVRRCSRRARRHLSDEPRLECDGDGGDRAEGLRKGARDAAPGPARPRHRRSVRHVHAHVLGHRAEAARVDRRWMRVRREDRAVRWRRRPPWWVDGGHDDRRPLADLHSAWVSPRADGACWHVASHVRVFRQLAPVRGGSGLWFWSGAASGDPRTPCVGFLRMPRGLSPPPRGVGTSGIRADAARGRAQRTRQRTRESATELIGGSDRECRGSLSSRGEHANRAARARAPGEGARSSERLTQMTVKHQLLESTDTTESRLPRQSVLAVRHRVTESSRLSRPESGGRGFTLYARRCACVGLVWGAGDRRDWAHSPTRDTAVYFC